MAIRQEVRKIRNWRQLESELLGIMPLKGKKVYGNSRKTRQKADFKIGDF